MGDFELLKEFPKRLEKKRERGRWRRFSGQILALFLITFGLLFYLWPHYQMLKISDELQRLRMEYTKEMEDASLFKVEIASLKSPGRIEHVAKEQLGMLFPGKDQVIIIDGAQVEGSYGPDRARAK